jgi:hypothetical protein
MIATLKAKKIVWDANLANPKNLEIFAVTADGTDFKTREPKHPSLSRDNTACSKKVNTVKYKVELAVHRAKVVHIAGPFKGGVHDLEMFRRGGLKEKLKRLNQKIRDF